MKVVLLGYMGSGKSSIGKVLAKTLNLPFIDLDEYIEYQEKLSISEIFRTKGEIYFRKIEGLYLKEILQLKYDAVISLGGGTPCYGKNLELIQQNSKSIYLKASIDAILSRLKNELTQRPLIAEIGIENLKEYIAKHLFERTSFYEKATHTVLVNSKSIEEIVEEINNLL